MTKIIDGQVDEVYWMTLGAYVEVTIQMGIPGVTTIRYLTLVNNRQVAAVLR